MKEIQLDWYKLLAEDLISYLYVAKETETQNDVFIWKYKPRFLSPNLISRLTQASERITQWSHPHSLKLKRFFERKNAFYTVYEAEENVLSLEDYLRNEKNWNLNIFWKFSTQLLSVLMDIESQNFVFGTFSLNALFVTEEQNIKLTRPFLPMLIIQHVFPHLEVVDDGIFYSPEFIQKQIASTQLDIYAFGVLLYFLFSGQWPYRHAVNISALKQNFLIPPRSLKELNPSLPDKLEKMIHLCLERDPSFRFSSFSQLIQYYQEGKFEHSRHAALLKPSEGIIKEFEKSARHAKKRKIRMVAKITGVFMFVGTVLSGVYFIYVTYLTQLDIIQIPDVRGLPQEQAIQILKEHHLETIVVPERSHSYHPDGVVMDQKPAPGRPVKEKRPIRLFISKGESPLLIPDLSGRNLDDALVIAKEQELEIDVIGNAYSNQIRSGVIMSQHPSPNALVTKNQHIQVLVSEGFPIRIRFQNKSKIPTSYTDAAIDIFIPDEWSTQDIKILFVYSGERKILHYKRYLPGETDQLTHSLKEGGYLEVFFNEQLAYKEKIHSVTSNPEHRPVITPDVLDEI